MLNVINSSHRANTAKGIKDLSVWINKTTHQNKIITTALICTYKKKRFQNFPEKDNGWSENRINKRDKISHTQLNRKGKLRICLALFTGLFLEVKLCFSGIWRLNEERSSMVQPVVFPDLLVQRSIHTANIMLFVWLWNQTPCKVK